GGQAERCQGGKVPGTYWGRHRPRRRWKGARHLLRPGRRRAERCLAPVGRDCGGRCQAAEGARHPLASGCLQPVGRYGSFEDRAYTHDFRRAVMMTIESQLAVALRAAYLTLHRRSDARFARYEVTADQFVLLATLARG